MWAWCGPPSCPTGHPNTPACTRNPVLPQPPYPAGAPRASVTTVPVSLSPAGTHCLSHPAWKRGPFCSHATEVQGISPSGEARIPTCKQRAEQSWESPLPASPASSHQLPLRPERAEETAPVCPRPSPPPTPALPWSVRPRGGLREPNIHTGAGQQREMGRETPGRTGWWWARLGAPSRPGSTQGPGGHPEPAWGRDPAKPPSRDGAGTQSTPADMASRTGREDDAGKTAGHACQQLGHGVLGHPRG